MADHNILTLLDQGLCVTVNSDDPAYFGGTVNKAVGSEEIVEGIRRGGHNAQHIADREACGAALVELAREGDRIVIMGARDDSLPAFAADILARIAMR